MNLRALLSALVLCSSAAARQPPHSSERLVAHLPLRYSALDCDQLPSSVAGDVALCCEVEADAGCGDGYAWVCQDGAGASIPVNNKCGNGAETGPFADRTGAQKYVLKNLVDATAPRVLAADAAAAGLDTLIAANAWTAYVVARPVATAAELVEYGVFGTPTQGFTLEAQGASGVRCYRGDGSVTSGTAGNGYAVANEWIATSCTYNGTTLRQRMQNGAAGTVAASAAQAPTNDNLMFGTGDAGGNPITGNLYFVAIFDRVLADTELDALNQLAWGTQGSRFHAATNRETTAMIEGGDGQWYSMGRDVMIAQADGLESHTPVTNYWQSWLDASAWTSVGTPTITTNTDAGPFSKYANGNEADTISDDDVAALEGKASSSAGTTTGTYYVSCWLAAGTSTDYTLSVVTDGTGGGSCTGTNLTSSFVRQECYPTAVGGAPTTITGRVLVGDAVGDTGTIRVAGCQLERSAAQVFAGRPCPTNGAAATCNADFTSFAATDVPTRRARVEYAMKGRYARQQAYAANFRPISCAQQFDAAGWEIVGKPVAGSDDNCPCVDWANPPTLSSCVDADTANTCAYAGGSAHRYSFWWREDGEWEGLYDGTRIKVGDPSLTAGANPTTISGGLCYIGTEGRLTGFSHINGRIHDLRIFRW